MSKCKTRTLVLTATLAVGAVLAGDALNTMSRTDCLIALATAADADAPRPAPEDSALQGAWEHVETESAGYREGPAECQAKNPEPLVFKGDLFLEEALDVITGSRISLRYRVALGLKSNPKTIDLIDDNGRLVGKGIYKVEGDRLFIAFGPTTKPRVANFQSKLYVVNLTYRRLGPSAVLVHELYARGRPSPAKDRCGDPLPESALARLGSLRFRHTDAASCLVFTSDGKRLVSGSWDRTLRVWDTRTGKELRQLYTDMEDMRCVALAPDDSTLAVADYHKLELWDLARDRKLSEIEAAAGSVAFMPDGKSVVSGGSDDKDVCLWRVSTGTSVWKASGHKGIVRAVAPSPDGKRIASAGADRVVHLWDAAAGKVVRTFRGHKSGVMGVSFSPRGDRVASADEEGTLLVWEPATGKVLRRLNAPGCEAVTFLAGGRLVVSAGILGVRFWDVATGKERSGLKQELSRIRAIASTRDGKLLATTDGNAVRLWDQATGDEVHPLEAHRYTVGALAFGPGGRALASGSADGLVRVWQPETGKALLRIGQPRLKPPDSAPVTCLAYSPDGRVLAAGTLAGGVRICNAADGREVRVLGAAGGAPVRLAFSPDRRVLAAAYEEKGGLRLWDPSGGKELGQVPWAHEETTALVFSPNGRWLAVAGHEHTRPKDPGEVLLWDVARRTKAASVVRRERRVDALAISPDGALLATGGPDDVIRLWAVPGGKPLYAFAGPAADVTDLAFSGDGHSLLAGGTANVVRLWEVATGRERLRWYGHAGPVRAVAFAQGGGLAASGGDDTTVLVWDVRGPARRLRARGTRLGPDHCKALWEELGSPNAVRAYRALWCLAADPDAAAAFLGRTLTPAREVEAATLERLIAELDDRRFASRQRAYERLEQLGDMAALALRRSRGKMPSAEAERRVEGLLKSLQGPATRPAQLRAIRGIELLEALGTPAARQVLTAVAGGAPGAGQTREARAALGRLM
jgi:uncharacterized protein (TIGR03067 family)